MPPEVPYNFDPLMVDGYFTVGGNVDSALPSSSKPPPFRFDPSFVVKVKPSQVVVDTNFDTENQVTTNELENLSADQQKMIQTITEIAKTHGLDPNFMNNVAYNESRFDPGAKNAIGGTGLFQITGPTWNDLRKHYGRKYNFTANGRTDPVQNATAAALLLLGHRKNYEDNGFPANNTDLYIGNFLGRTGGRKFLNEYYNGDKNKIVAVNMPKAAENNPTLFYKDYKKYGTKYPRTYAELYDLMAGKLNYTFLENEP